MTTDERQFASISCVDWSAAATPTTGKDSIWSATTIDGEATTPRNHPTRASWEHWFRDLLETPSAGPRLVGIDVSLAAPTGLATALGWTSASALPPWRHVWATIAELLVDHDDNANNRFEVGAALNARIGGVDGPFWGHPPSQRHDGLAATRPRFPHLTPAGNELGEYRIDEAWTRSAGLAPQSTWKLAYQASVGGQFLTCVPRLHRLKEEYPHLRFWPLEVGFAARPSAGEVWVSEVWPSAWPLDGLHTVRDADQVATAVARLFDADRAGELADWLAGDSRLTDADRTIVCREEGWMLGPETIRLPRRPVSP